MEIYGIRKVDASGDAVLVFFCPEGAVLSESVLELGKARGVDENCRFSGQAGRIKRCSGVEGGCALVGVGPREDMDLDALRAAVGAVVRMAANQEVSSLVFHAAQLSGLGLDGDLVGEVVLAARLAAYAFLDFKTETKAEECPGTLMIWDEQMDVSETISGADALAQGVILARDLVNMPANVATPEFLSDQARTLASAFGFGVRVFDPEEILAMGMGCFGAVFQGSSTPARFIVLDSTPGSAETPLVFVGKGVTFDTGGISLKPGAKMHEMKGDMAGAAAILGYFRSRGLTGNHGRRVVGLLPCTENVPGSRAVKPGDVVTAMNGKTVEILNTDAEGRLLLADALSYSARFAPEIIVDLATLTGACLVALGTKVAAVFATTPELEWRIREGGAKSGERFWPMPLWKEYAAPLKSEVADLKNIAVREGGAIFAAVFLKHFVPEKTDWAHLDIAGPAWTEENASVFKPGGTGFGVRTLWELVASFA